MTVILCAPDQFILRRIRHCPTCKRRRRFSGRDALWYGTTWACCGCGDRWTDGERHERPFRRGWRRESIAQARADWAVGSGDRAAFQAWLTAQIHAA